MRRMLVGMSQEKLGESLGLTFQQVQKYEKGANRIGASRLYQIARVLSVPVEFFYEGIQIEEAVEGQGMAEAEPANFDFDMLSTSEGIQLNSAFFAIRDPKVRKRVLELVKALGETESGGHSEGADGSALDGELVDEI
ncbi:helix-turn-helix domain-containing protein [Parvibaculum sp.]|uniref:helix-turn-helix domain-containing protein n=1 Tax=Parvibaculum sp. TaxID=2024848 RepID=UPI00320FBB81